MNEKAAGGDSRPTDIFTSNIFPHVQLKRHILSNPQILKPQTKLKVRKNSFNKKHVRLLTADLQEPSGCGLVWTLTLKYIRGREQTQISKLSTPSIPSFQQHLSVRTEIAHWPTAQSWKCGCNKPTVLRFNKHGPWETCTSVQSPNFASVGPGAIQPGCGHLHCTMQVAADCPDSRLAPQLPSRGCVRDKLGWTIHASECILVKGFGLSTLRCISDVDFCKHLVKGNKHGVRCSFVI